MMPDRAADVLGEFDAKDRYPSPIPPPESAATLQRPKEAGHSINFSEVLNPRLPQYLYSRRCA